MAMNLYQDVKELLADVEEKISKISEHYDAARRDEASKNISRPLIKSCLEHLRSTLEYSAQDIWNTYSTEPNKRIYFPYGAEEDLFNKSVNRNLPRLKENRIEVYYLIESLQPHKCKDNWLISLCDIANINKHNKLGTQTREHSRNNTITIGGITMRGSVGGKITNCHYNGIPLGSDKNIFTVSNYDPIEETRKKINKSVPFTIEFDWVKFNFENTKIDILQLIQKSHKEITNYVESLNCELLK